MADEYKAKKNYTITIIMMLLAAGAGSIIDLDDLKAELDGYYICPVSEGTYEFDRLSGSEQRGYPYQDSNKGYKDCKDSIGARHQWRDLYEYAIEIGVDPYDFIQTEKKPQSSGIASGVWGDHYIIKQGQAPVLIE